MQRSILTHQEAIREHEHLSAEVEESVQNQNRRAMNEAQEAQRIVDENERRGIERDWEEMERSSQPDTTTPHKTQRSQATRGHPNRRRRGHPNPPRP